MALTKAQLVAALSLAPFNYIGIGNPVNPGNPPEGEVNHITKYIVNVLEVGTSQTNQLPTAYRKNVIFYVYNEGQGDEAAYFERTEPTNSSNTNVASSSTDFESYATLYLSDCLRKRMMGWVIKKAGTVYVAFYDNTSALPSNPTAGDKWVAKVTANGWTAGHLYTWSGSVWTNGALYGRKSKWAADAFKDPSKYINICMSYLAQSDDARALGNGATDADLSWLAYMIGNIADMYGFTDV